MSGEMKRKLPPLKSLQAFEAVARYGSATEASAELNVTEPAISQQLKNLEGYLGIKLFERTHEGLRLNPEGKYLFPIIKNLFDEVDDAVAVLTKQKKRQSLSIRVTPHFSARWLTPRLGEFTKKYPDIDISLQTSIDRRLLTKGDVDVAITWETGSKKIPLGEELMKLWWVPMCRPGFLDGAESLDAPEDLLNYLLIHETDYEQWTAWFEAAGVNDFRPRKELMIDNFEVVYQAVLAGRGIALLMYPLFSQDMEEGELIAPLGTDLILPITWYIIRTKEEHLRPEVQVFCEWLHDQASSIEMPLVF